MRRTILSKRGPYRPTPPAPATVDLIISFPHTAMGSDYQIVDDKTGNVLHAGVLASMDMCFPIEKNTTIKVFILKAGMLPYRHSWRMGGCMTFNYHPITEHEAQHRTAPLEEPAGHEGHTHAMMLGEIYTL